MTIEPIITGNHCTPIVVTVNTTCKQFRSNYIYVAVINEI